VFVLKSNPIARLSLRALFIGGLCNFYGTLTLFLRILIFEIGLVFLYSWSYPFGKFYPRLTFTLGFLKYWVTGCSIFSVSWPCSIVVKSASVFGLTGFSSIGFSSIGFSSICFVLLSVASWFSSNSRSFKFLCCNKMALSLTLTGRLP
jgi:hypothetical protein